MVKIEVNEAETNITTEGARRTLLMECTLAIYVMARSLKNRDPGLAELYRRFVLDAVTADDFLELVDSGIDIAPDAEGVEEDIPF